MPDSKKPKILIADYDFGEVEIEQKLIESAGMELIPAQCKSEQEVINAAKDAHGILTQYSALTEKVISTLPHCKVISRYGTGVDIVDVDAATRKGIQVTNAPSNWCSDEVADHAVALLLAAIRKIKTYDKATRQNTWHWKSGQPIYRIRDSVLGLLSFGSIARGVAKRMAGFGVRVHVHDPFKSEEKIRKLGAVPVTFDQLLEESDYLVIQAPLTKKTRGLFGEAELQRMKRNAILINTARGPIVQDQALYRALSENWIAGAGLDDIQEEPSKKRQWTSTNPLFTLENVLITPHAAYYSEESIRNVREIAASEAIRVIQGEAPRFPVNRVFESISKAA
jgi:D-3-phosphoglycerate dehydrogenase